MDALVGFINKTKASGEWDLPSQEGFYRLVYILIEAVRAECDNSFVFNPDFINVRASLSPSASMALLSDEMRFVRAVFDKAKAEVNVDVVTQYVKDASNLDSKIAQIESAERRVSELEKKLDEQEVGYNFVGLYEAFHGLRKQKSKELYRQRIWLFALGCLGSVRKVLPQASQRASQRDHCGKTPGELVVTGANSPVLF
ncbi:hypothetical protein [Metapseudomonas otitidis]|uniref:hypothetical protein n=1 Tax=Metapseudomonas otitidis TaxID=319939 RepID=UPI003CF834F7